MGFLKGLLLIVLPLVLLGYVIYFTQPPKSWKEASLFQVLSISLPLLFFLAFFLNLFFNFLPRSFVIALSFILLLVLRITNSLNIFTGIVTGIILIYLIFFFKTPYFSRFKKGLTRGDKIPKLKHLRGRNR